jgi:hypothetical protein
VDIDAFLNAPMEYDDMEEDIDELWNSPIYAGSDCTVGRYVVMILSDCIMYKYSKSCLQTRLLEDHALKPQPNNIPTTVYRFRKLFKYKIVYEMKKVYVCGNLDHTFTADEATKKIECPFCHAPFENASYFYIGSLDKIVEILMADKKVATELMLDITTSDEFKGERIRELFNLYQHLPRQGTLFWGLCTDGVSPYHSSQKSLWPFFLSCVNLRMETKKLFSRNPLIAIWFGPLPRSGEIIFRFILSQFKIRFRHGLECEFRGTRVKIFSVLLWCVLDLDALAKILKIHLYRGYDGCLNCYIKGDQTATGVKFPTPSLFPRRTDYLVRLQRELEDDVSLPFQEPSIFEELEYWDIISSWTIDFMHLAFLNVAKSHFHLFFSSTPRGEMPDAFNLEDCMAEINQFLATVIFPHDFGRPVKSLQVTGWKAEQWKNFFLFLILPCVHPHLGEAYFSHLKCFITFMKLVISGEPNADIDAVLLEAEQNVRNYVFKFPELYGEENCYFCVHYLIHVIADVRKYGWMSNHWMFLFEGLNGFMVGQVPQTANNIVPNIAEKFKMITNIAILRESLGPLPRSMKDLPSCQPLFFETATSNANAILGKLEYCDVQIVIGLRTLSFVESGKRIRFSNEEYHSMLWKQGNNSSSMYVRIAQTDGSEFARIERFYKAQSGLFYAEVTLIAAVEPTYRGLRRIEFRPNRCYLNMKLVKSKIALCKQMNNLYIIPLD